MGMEALRADKTWSIAVIAVAEVMAMALWFSASAVVPALARDYALDGFTQALFTSAVQAGFVAGSLASAVLGLPDRFDPRRIFLAAALVGAAANLAILGLDPGSPAVAVLRFVTGMAMAGVYPVGMKLAATWADRDMGLMVGILVGALTLGSAAPHLFNALGGVEWRLTLLAASVSAAAGGCAIVLAGLGPAAAPAPRFDPGYVLEIWRNPAIRLANFGYLGHMWELYAMWAWVGVFLQASFAIALPAGTAAFWAKMATFATVGVGALGCLAGGLFADRLGRTAVTMAAMAVSGTVAAVIGLLFGGDPVLLTLLCLVWGVAVVADSAQFSAAVAELSPPERIGTMLTVQTCLGFTLTLITIHLMPWAVAALGWERAFMVLAAGPFLGVLAMGRLRRRPEAVRLAGGRR
ncbi:MAG: MFS transporter [Alphaproteobacteria bacterium]|nr:MFS transporter [Alphaproteobacteria bacterium]